MSATQEPATEPLPSTGGAGSVAEQAEEEPLEEEEPFEEEDLPEDLEF